MTEARIERRGPGRFWVSGELRFATVPQAWKQAVSALDPADRWEVHLEEVTRSDSAALAFLVEWVREARHRGTQIVLLDPPQQMIAIARVSGLDQVLPFGRS